MMDYLFSTVLLFLILGRLFIILWLRVRSMLSNRNMAGWEIEVQRNFTFATRLLQRSFFSPHINNPCMFITHIFCTHFPTYFLQMVWTHVFSRTFSRLIFCTCSPHTCFSHTFSTTHLPKMFFHTPFMHIFPACFCHTFFRHVFHTYLFHMLFPHVFPTWFSKTFF